jgi:hypothetical protein
MNSNQHKDLVNTTANWFSNKNTTKLVEKQQEPTENTAKTAEKPPNQPKNSLNQLQNNRTGQLTN